MQPAAGLIIFDFDGTLGDTRRNIVDTLQDTMREVGLRVRDEASCAATIGLTLTDSFAALFPEITREQALACTDAYRRIFEQNRLKHVPAAFPGTRETLAKLRERNFILTVASSRSSRSLHMLLSEMGLEPYIDFIVGADDVQHPKPHPEPVLKTLEAMGVPADRTLVVGDMPVDILMGRGAGVHTCAVTYGNASREELEAAGADCIIDRIEDLPGAILNPDL